MPLVTGGVAIEERSDAGGVRPWLAVVSVALGTFVVVTTEFLPIGLLGTVAADMRVMVGTAGLMVAIPGGIAAIAAPAITLLAKGIDRRLLLIGFAALVMLSNVVVALASGFATILIGRVLLGIGVGGFWTFAVSAGRRLVAEAQGGRATAIILAGVSVGTVVGMPIGTALGALAGWRFAFGGVAALAGLTALGQALLLSSLPSRHVVSFGSLVGLFRVRATTTGFLAAALIAAGHFTAYTYLEPFLSRIVQLTPSGLSWTLAAYGTAGVVGNFAGERATAHDLRRTFIGIALLMGLVIIMAAASGANDTEAIVAVVTWGAAFGAVPVCIQIWIYRSAPERFETSSAMMVTVFQVAIAAGSLGGGAVVDRVGIVPAFILGGVLSLGCGLLVLFARPPPEDRIVMPA